MESSPYFIDKDPDIFIEFATSLNLLTYLDAKVTIWLGYITIFDCSCAIMSLFFASVTITDVGVGVVAGVVAGVVVAILVVVPSVFGLVLVAEAKEAVLGL